MINVQEYGAKGNLSEQADDTPAFRAALADARLKGAPLYVPRGQGDPGANADQYPVSGLALASGDVITCDSTARIKRVAGSAEPILATTGSTTNIRIVGGTWRSANVFLRHTGMSALTSSVFECMQVDTDQGFVLDAAVGNRFVGLRFNRCDQPFVLTGVGASNQNLWRSCHFVGGTIGTPWTFANNGPGNQTSNTIDTCWVENVQRSALIARSNLSGLRVVRTRFENEGAPIDLRPDEGRTVKHVVFQDCFWGSSNIPVRIQRAEHTHLSIVRGNGHIAGSVADGRFLDLNLPGRGFLIDLTISPLDVS